MQPTESVFSPPRSRRISSSWKKKLVLVPPPLGSALFLKVQLNDLLSRRRLSQATVEVFVNHSRTLAVLTGEDGEVSLRIPHLGRSLVTVVASKDGYVSTQLPCITDQPAGEIRPGHFSLHST